ncbi:hypothetical protein CEP54_013632 [Fusarium duplospermum]|uniref:Uncharacterized protein n=1 Tax=Fusarium duplospermum TaxID=1325734 RepID=A0A428P1L1_9HYPO|nr:hypothetical protein CEP54_013632 [Fusarium duplospermum]
MSCAVQCSADLGRQFSLHQTKHGGGETAGQSQQHGALQEVDLTHTFTRQTNSEHCRYFHIVYDCAIVMQWVRSCHVDEDLRSTLTRWGRGPSSPLQRIVKGPSDDHGGTTAHSMDGVDAEKEASEQHRPSRPPVYQTLEYQVIDDQPSEAISVYRVQHASQHIKGRVFTRRNINSTEISTCLPEWKTCTMMNRPLAAE